VAGCVCLRCLVVLPASKDRRLGFCLVCRVSGFWTHGDPSGFVGLRGLVACIVAALGVYCEVYVAAL
jgi:hypothetical protein